MTSVADQLQATTKLRPNMVVAIHTSPSITYISKRQPDSGLVIPVELRKLIDSFKVNATVVDIRRSKRNTATATVKIGDKKQAFSNLLSLPVSSLIGLQIDLYYGLSNGATDFADYILIDTYIIRKIKKSGEFYTITCRSPTDKLNKDAFDLKGNLDSSISAVAVTADILTGGDIYPAAGRIKMGEEFIQYTGKSYVDPVTTITGMSRGDEGSTAVAHDAGVETVFYEKVVINPIDLLLQLMISTGNGTGGVYDVLSDGGGIPEAFVDVAKFLQIKADFFPTDVFTLKLIDMTTQNLLKFIESELLKANNVRFVDKEGKVSLAALDQSVPGTSLPIVDSTVIQDLKEGWDVDDSQIVNKFTMLYGYDEAGSRYTRKKDFEDADSILLYGERKGSEQRFKGIFSDAIAQDRGDRFIARFSTPMVTVTSTNFLKTYAQVAGDKVQFSHPDIPAAGGGLGINAELEVLKRGIDFAQSANKATYVYTSYFNIRRALIAPAPFPVSIPSPNQFEVPAGCGTSYRVGFKLAVFTWPALIQTTDPIAEVIGISGDIITIDQNWTTLDLTKRIGFADYGFQSPEQKGRYGSIVENSGLFADGTGAYKIF